MEGFSNFGLSPEIQSALKVLKYEKPTEIQKIVIPLALNADNIMAGSGTGSGKTAAFAIPICEGIDWEINEPQALILEPTRELTVQVAYEISQIGRKKRIKTADVFGGFPIDKQIRTLKQKTHIVVGTPGRVLDHIRRGSLKLDRIKTVVIDEADLMLDMGFAEEVKTILSFVEAQHNTMLFSATLTDEIKELTQGAIENAHLILLEEEERGVITEKLYFAESESKYQIFLQILKQEDPVNAMIFCGTKEMVNVLCRKMQRDGIRCAMIHGDLDQQDRIRTVESFRENRVRYLIATDVVARGIDFERLSHVFNYDFPTGRETYVHRIGRTGRNGANGTAVSIVTTEDERMKSQVERFLGYELPYWQMSEITPEQESKFWLHQKKAPVKREKKGAGFATEIIRLFIGGGKKSKMRAGDIVGAISNIEGITSEDIGVIDVRESLTYVEILNKKGSLVEKELLKKPIKGKIRKVRRTRS